MLHSLVIHNILISILLFKRRDSTLKSIFYPVRETTNYYAKPILLTQVMYANKTGFDYHLLMEVKVKNLDGSNTTHLSNSKIDSSSDPIVFSNHYLFPQEIDTETIRATGDDTLINFYFKDSSSSFIKILQSNTDSGVNSPNRLLDIGVSNYEVLHVQTISGRTNGDNWITYIDNGVLNFAAFQWDLGADRTCIDSPSFTFTNSSDMGALNKNTAYIEMTAVQDFTISDYNSLYTANGIEQGTSKTNVTYNQANFEEHN